jgi:hypothetical protein
MKKDGGDQCEQALQRVEKERNILHKIKRRQATCIGRILCRNCLIKHIIYVKMEEEFEGRGRERRGGKQLLDGLNKPR